MHDPAWKKRYHVRAGVEGTLSQAVRAFGLQQVCTAAAMNVARVVRWLERVPRAKTRVTRFAALARAA
jgi:transposase